MSGFLTAAQSVVYNAIRAATVRPVYDSPPQVPEGMPRDALPYIVIGSDTENDNSTDTDLMSSVTMTIHIWSAAHGFSEAKELGGTLYDALNRAELTHPNYQIIDCRYEFGQAIDDPSGHLKQVVQRYRLEMERL